MLDFFSAEIFGGDPLGFLEGELQFHRLSRRFFEVDGDFFSRKIPIDHLTGAEGFVNTKVSGSQLRKALADRIRNATGLNQFRHIRMHAKEDGKPTLKTQGIPLRNLSDVSLGACKHCLIHKSPKTALASSCGKWLGIAFYRLGAIMKPFRELPLPLAINLVRLESSNFLRA